MGFGIGLDWFGGLFVKRGMFGFQNPCSCFGYRLSYNQPNEVISIGKEP